MEHINGPVFVSPTANVDSIRNPYLFTCGDAFGSQNDRDAENSRSSYIKGAPPANKMISNALVDNSEHDVL